MLLSRSVISLLNWRLWLPRPCKVPTEPYKACSEWQVSPNAQGRIKTWAQLWHLLGLQSPKAPPPHACFPKQNARGTMAFPSHHALLPCVLHSTLPQSILILSTKLPRLPPTLPKSYPNFNPFPGGLIPSWRKPWSDTHVCLLSY